MTGVDEWTGRVHAGDALELLDDLPPDSIHAVVTDPPYGLAFMGRDWDTFEPREYQDWCQEWAELCLRVLRPGGHLLAFSGNRTHHRLFSGVEDAGFEIRDTLTWHYGSGFPKALDVGKAIDKAEGEEREVVGERVTPDGGRYADRNPEGESTDYGDKSVNMHVTEPATDAAREWDGWKTHLKPSTDFIVLARKPLPGTVAECVREWGTGALNIDGTRIENGERPNRRNTSHETGGSDKYGEYERDTSRADGTTTEGRYPANLLLDETAARRMNAEVGELGNQYRPNTDKKSGSGSTVYGENDDRYGEENHGYDDSGGPSRYFYTSKASRKERTLDGQIANQHPTVKPIDLMEWLVRLATAPRQVVLDPFTGSGTTCRAAKNQNRRFIGIEQSEEWADVARARAGLDVVDPSHVLGDSGQATAGDF